MGNVIFCAAEKHGELIGTYDDNLILNSYLYEVEFPDGEVKQFAANILADNCMSQVDSNGHHSQFLDCINNVRCDDRDIAKSDGYNMTKRGKRKLRETTVIWYFEIKCKNGTKQWVLKPVGEKEYLRARAHTHMRV